ncbi:phospholipid-binding protein MlaC [Methyloversatilis sp.]|uniref:MlaC/ttg2D family ABC transporter substrate-binding protein n=1 Tax=Methyloversatilis sp. TaxID=2569862 RepID=UPI0027BB00BF|nr:ABC transporter substrate-binding protein [Methyloversatilis sp.]
MFKRIFQLFLLSFALSAGAQANVAKTPDTLVKEVTEEVLNTLRTDAAIKAGDKKRAAELVETQVIPHFNFSRMTQLAMGREWANASDEQKGQLITEFRTLLVRTYSNALTSYKNETVEFDPFRMTPEQTDVTVKTKVVRAGGRPIPIDYALEKKGEGWKVYDVSVAGVSLVTNYRETFASEIRAGGVDGLVKSLRSKNSPPAAAAK